MEKTPELLPRNDRLPEVVAPRSTSPLVRIGALGLALVLHAFLLSPFPRSVPKTSPERRIEVALVPLSGRTGEGGEGRSSQLPAQHPAARFAAGREQAASRPEAGRPEPARTAVTPPLPPAKPKTPPPLRTTPKTPPSPPTPPPPVEATAPTPPAEPSSPPRFPPDEEDLPAPLVWEPPGPVAAEFSPAPPASVDTAPRESNGTAVAEGNAVAAGSSEDEKPGALGSGGNERGAGPSAGREDRAEAAAGRGGAGGANAALDAYFAAVLARIEQAKSLVDPIVFARRRSAKVVVVFRLTREGSLARSVVAISSGRAGVDRAALDTIDRGAPYPRFPGDPGEAPPELQVIVSFDIR